MIAVAALATVATLSSCNKSSTAQNERAQNASNTYVAPGEKDEYYLFYSGGHSGQVFVAGIPSMRHITTIPVYAPYPATGFAQARRVMEAIRSGIRMSWRQASWHASTIAS